MDANTETTHRKNLIGLTRANWLRKSARWAKNRSG